MKRLPLLLAFIAFAMTLISCTNPTGEYVSDARSGLSFAPLKSGTIAQMNYSPCPGGNPTCWGGNGSVFFDNYNRCLGGPQLPNGTRNEYGSGVELMDFSSSVAQCDWTKPIKLLIWTTEENAPAKGRVERPLLPVVLPPIGWSGAASWSTVGWTQASPGHPWAAVGASGVGDVAAGPIFDVANGAINSPHEIDVSDLARDACTGGGQCILMLRSYDDDGDAYQDGQHWWLISASISLTCTALPVCGNSILEDGEMCDDGNVVDGDGCSATCQVEGAGGSGGAGAGGMSGAGGAVTTSSTSTGVGGTSSSTTTTSTTSAGGAGGAGGTGCP